MRAILPFALLGACALSAIARADLLEYTFSGDIFAVVGQLDDPWQDVAIGDTYFASFVIDSKEPDQDNGSTFGLYDLLWSTVEIDGMSETVAGTGFLQVEDGIVTDSIHFVSAVLPGESMFDIDLIGIDPIDSDVIPLEINLADFPGRAFEMVTPNGGAAFGFVESVTIQVIPAPATSFLLIAGLRFARRRRRSLPTEVDSHDSGDLL